MTPHSSRRAGKRAFCVHTFLLAIPAFCCAKDRPWTVEDSVAITYFVADPQSRFPRGNYMQASEPEGSIVVSPDGAHFLFVTYRGDLQQDQVIYELHVHRSSDVRDALEGDEKKTLAPLRRLTFASPHSDEFLAMGIYAPSWEDSTAIVFVGVDSTGTHRVYRLTVASGALTALTPENSDVLTMPHTPFVLRGTSVIFASRRYEAWRPLDEYPMATIRSHELAQILDDRRPVHTLHATYRGGPARVIARPAEGRYRAMQPSANEKWAVLIYPPADESIPPSWLDYEVRPQYGYRFVLVDLEAGQSRSFFDAPAGTVTQAGRGRSKPFDAFWSADSRHVILYNTALPLDVNREARRRMAYIVDYDVKTGRWSILQPMANARGERVRNAEWLKEGEQLLVAHETRDGAPSVGVLYSFTGRGWRKQTVPASKHAAHQPARLPGQLTVRLHENANEPPVMIAAEGDRQIALTEADPALVGIWRAKAETIQMSTRGKETQTALLMLPRDSSQSKPVPLVIQLAGGSESAFRPDGIAPGVYAAQALVAQGFAVLQMNVFGDRTSRLTPREGPEAVERIDFAIETLVSRGLVDPARVGLVGFSRAGYMAYYTISNPGRSPIAAAVVFDSVDAGYGSYVISAALGDPLDIYEKQYGVGTFWENKSEWLKTAPAFNVDRVRTPVLFGTTGDDCRWAPLETIGAFRHALRPFDYMCFPRASHVLQRPRQRHAAMQMTVDWMTFWLQGREDALAARGERLEHWRKVRADWQKTQADEPAARHANSLPVP